MKEFENNESLPFDKGGKSVASIQASVGWGFPEVKLAAWDPENEKQWNVSSVEAEQSSKSFIALEYSHARFVATQNGGSSIAHRNLVVSIPNLFCAFGVWLAWSIISSKIQLMHDEDPSIYPFQDFGSPTGNDYQVLLYTLPAVAGLSGGTLRIANSFMTPIVGGRNVVYQSSVMLTLAMVWTTLTLTSKTPPFTLLLVGAWLSGTGGGAFASSMSNMSTLFPKSQQGYCLGFNGGLGNLGVGVSQLLVPVFMNLPFGKVALAEGVEGWPNHGTFGLDYFLAEVTAG